MKRMSLVLALLLIALAAGCGSSGTSTPTTPTPANARLDHAIKRCMRAVAAGADYSVEPSCVRAQALEAVATR